ncbi:MAG: NADH:ubiquinone reductase (Na(+)-transporting) subunit C, partial [Schleiferiaceae bacterium]|nr:NADH:ubiquinone reductase (Na(+)-transporting) subunit C [Schleiferiaceae bacterium]
MDVNSNRYTYLFSIIMVVIVAVLLSLAATVLKPFQDANMVLEKKSNILGSIGLVSENPDSLFNSVIVEQLVIRNGEVIESEVSA